ncbi:methionyl-tRNA formyltransferase [bacterium]|nr:methionyl-tRNA formyltransferase [bacterium]
MDERKTRGEKSLKVVFMGTGKFGAKSLSCLLEDSFFDVVVATQPDSQKDRGHKLKPSHVKQITLERNLRVYQPVKLNKEFFENTILYEKPDIVLVADYGLKIPKRFLEYPKYGCVNVHPSLLPRYRGAAPVNWTLIRGEKITGVTTIMMDEGWDSGDILLQESTGIYPEENARMLRDRLAEMGAKLLVKTAYGLFENTIERRKQDHSQATFAPFLKKDDGLISWSMSAEHIVNLVRGLSPVPGTYTFYKDKMLKILLAKQLVMNVNGFKDSVSGEIAFADPKKGLVVKTGADSFVSILELQPAGKNWMSWRDFLSGYRIKVGNQFTQKPEPSLFKVTKR